MKITPRQLKKIIKEVLEEAEQQEVTPDKLEAAGIDPQKAKEFLKKYENAVITKAKELKQTEPVTEGSIDTMDIAEMDPRAKGMLEKSVARAAQMLGINIKAVGVPLAYIGWKALMFLGVGFNMALLGGLTYSFLVPAIGIYLARTYIDAMDFKRRLHRAKGKTRNPNQPQDVRK